MTKHTPGPWEVGGPFPRLTVIYCEDQGQGFPDPEPPMYGCIADLGTRDPETTDPDDESLANARLIAAAPELLEACRIALEDAIRVRDFLASASALVPNLEPLPANEELPGMKLLRVAIAKAEGNA